MCLTVPTIVFALLLRTRSFTAEDCSGLSCLAPHRRAITMHGAFTNSWHQSAARRRCAQRWVANPCVVMRVQYLDNGQLHWDSALIPVAFDAMPRPHYLSTMPSQCGSGVRRLADGGACSRGFRADQYCFAGRTRTQSDLTTREPRCRAFCRDDDPQGADQPQADAQYRHGCTDATGKPACHQRPAPPPQMDTALAGSSRAVL